MTLVFDTSVLIDIEKKDFKTMEKVEELSKLYPYLPKITFMTHFEFLLGLKKIKKENEIALNFLNNFNVLQTSLKTSEILSDLRVKYDKLGIKIALGDFLTASQAIEHNLVLVTKDQDFKEIKELKKIIL